MKVLMITPYVTIEGRPEFERNKTGFGYMVMDIAKAVGKKEHVDVLATDTRGGRFEHEGVKFLKRSIVTYLLSLYNCMSLGTLFGLRKNYSMSNDAFVRLVYYWLMTGYLGQLLKNEKYDIVHVHGCGFATNLWMKVCKQCDQKYLVTLHGLNSFSDTVNISPAGKQYERDFLKRVVKGEFPITVISTGMKRLIEKTCGVMDCKEITVVCNSHSFGNADSSISSGQVPKISNGSKSIREKYNIPLTAKVLLYVGNISENKNQRQMVEAFDLLPEEMRNNTWELFCGRPSMDGRFEEYARNRSYSDHLILCGAVKKSEMSNYFMEADGVVLLSHSEGFGLSLVEGMHFGVPCAMFNDMDAFEDIYDERAVVAIGNRNNEAVALALRDLLLKEWDMEAIKDSSKRFESGMMAHNYIKVYQNTLK